MNNIHFIKSDTPTNVVCSVARNQKHYFHIEHYSPMLDMGDFYVNVVITDPEVKIYPGDLVLHDGTTLIANHNNAVLLSDSPHPRDKIIFSNNPELTPSSTMSDRTIKIILNRYRHWYQPTEMKVSITEGGEVKFIGAKSEFPEDELRRFTKSANRLHDAVKKLKNIVTDEDIEAAASSYQYEGDIGVPLSIREHVAFQAGVNWYKQQIEK